MSSYCPPKILPIFNEDNFKCDDSGASSNSNIEKDIYNSQSVSTLQPITANSFEFDEINDQIYYTIAFLGTATVSSEIATVGVGTTVGSFISLRNKKMAFLTNGHNVISRFPAKFNGSVGCQTSMGIGSPGLSDLFVGYYFDGVFYISKSEGGIYTTFEIEILTNPGGIETATLTLDDVPYTIPLILSTSKAFTSDQISRGLTAVSPYFSQQVEDNVIGANLQPLEQTGVFSFSSTGTATANVNVLQVGSDVTTTYIPISQFNGDASTIANFDPTEWNSYELDISMLGVMLIKLYDNSTKQYKLLHTINNENQINFTTSKIYLQRIAIQGLGFFSDSFETFDGSLFSNTEVIKSTPFYSTSTSRTISAEENIINLNHAILTNNEPSDNRVFLQELDVSSDGTKAVVIRIYFDPLTVGQNTQADFQDNQMVNPSSTICADTYSATFTGGTLIRSFVMGRVDSRQIPLNNLPLYIHDKYVFTAESANTTDITLSVSWSE
jgi:hypothetical protein